MTARARSCAALVALTGLVAGAVAAATLADPTRTSPALWPAVVAVVVGVPLLRRTPGARGLRDGALLAGFAAGAGAALLGGTLAAAAGAAVAGAAQLLVTLALLHRAPRSRAEGRAHGPPTLRSMRDVVALAAASAAAGAVWFGAWLLAPGLRLGGGPPGGSLLHHGAQALAEAIAQFVALALVLRLVDPVTRRPHLDAVRPGETAAVLAATAGTCLLVFGQDLQLPLAYLVLPVGLWAALRLDVAAAALHVVLVGCLVGWFTARGTGPFAVAAPDLRAALVQGFVAVVAVTTLTVAVGRDERQRLLASLEQATTRATRQADQLAEAAARRANLLRVISHELRTPLNGVLGATALLASTPLVPQQRAWLTAAERSGRALLDIVEDVLDTTRDDEDDEVFVERMPFDVADAVRDAVHPLHDRAARRGLTLTVHVPASLRTRRLGDAARLRQVVARLADNAVKFTEQGAVTVVLLGDDDHVTVTVHDTGIGISAEQQERLFAPFAFADASATRPVGGAGLGLAVVAGRVRRLGGQVDVLSAPGLGSTFTVRLPLPVAEEAPDAAGAARPTAPAHPLTVLVAEDNDLNQVIARATLEAAGLTVEVVPDGAAAVAAATGREFAAVFMDCHMPVLDGLEATRRIRAAERATGRHVPIVAMTASTSDGDRSACLAAGMDLFLPKPWTSEQLQAALALVRTASPAPVPAPVPQPGTEPGIAAGVLARLDELLDGVPAPEAAAMRTRMLDSFLTRAPAMLDALAAALRAGDGGEVTRQAHALRGMAANLGAGELARVATAVELGEVTGDTAAQAVAAAFADVRAALRALPSEPVGGSSTTPAPPMERL